MADFELAYKRAEKIIKSKARSRERHCFISDLDLGLHKATNANEVMGQVISQLQQEGFTIIYPWLKTRSCFGEKLKNPRWVYTSFEISW